ELQEAVFVGHWVNDPRHNGTLCLAPTGLSPPCCPLSGVACAFPSGQRALSAQPGGDAAAARRARSLGATPECLAAWGERPGAPAPLPTVSARDLHPNCVRLLVEVLADCGEAFMRQLLSGLAGLGIVLAVLVGAAYLFPTGTRELGLDVWSLPALAVQ